VLVHAIEQWGVAEALSRIDGMFAFAVWDTRTRRLALVRDRAGKKPLYYGWFGGVFAFASELKALRAHPRFDDALDLDALGEFLRFDTVPQPTCIYRCVRKLMPGTWLEVGPGDTPWAIEPRAYWRAADVAANAAREPFRGDYTEAIAAVDARLSDAVRARLVADVPLGALFSGGIDSSVVVAIMQSLTDEPVKTFTIGFHEPRFNEAEHAAAIARHLGTEHHELYLTAQQTLEVVEQLPRIYDEPYAYASQIPTYLLSKLAREHVTVALSGDGGDELFAGYNRYHKVLRRWQRLQRLPKSLRAAISGLEHGARTLAWQTLGPNDPFARDATKLQRLAGGIGRRWAHWLADDPNTLMRTEITNGMSTADLVPEAREPRHTLTDPEAWAPVEDGLLKLRHFDYISYLADAVLTKIDRASMAVSLEVRSPLLDTALLELAWSLPAQYLVSDTGGKRVLKDVLARYLPRDLFERPKRGFNVPIRQWLRGPLRDWAEAYLSATWLRDQGIFDVKAVRQLWGQHQCGWDNHTEALWSLLMFQAWWAAQRAEDNLLQRSLSQANA
jgi:asparagine synthase (glutamine-hydrolysing)